MKKGMFFFLAIGLLFFGSGCASSSKAALVSYTDPMALVSVVSNWDINWKGEEPENINLIGPLINRALKSDPGLAYVSNAEELVNVAETTFSNIISGSNRLKLAEKDTVLSSQAYKNAAINKRHVNNKLITPDNYRLIDYRDKAFFSALARETGLKRSMFVEFNFTKAMTSGFAKVGDCEADVEMLVIVLDNQGKTVYRNTFNEWSFSRIRVTSGAYLEAELMELFKLVLDDISFDFLAHIGITI